MASYSPSSRPPADRDPAFCRRRTTLRRHGPLTSGGTAETSSAVCGASTNAISAPAANAALARTTASSKPATARASVRAMIVKSRSRRAAAAARIFASQSSRGMTCLPSRWPHFSREFLVLDVYSRDAAALELADRAKGVELIAVAGIGVGDDGQLDRGGDAPGIGHHLGQRDETKIGVSQCRRGAGAGHVDVANPACSISLAVMQS